MFKKKPVEVLFYNSLYIIAWNYRNLGRYTRKCVVRFHHNNFYSAWRNLDLTGRDFLMFFLNFHTIFPRKFTKFKWGTATHYEEILVWLKKICFGNSGFNKISAIVTIFKLEYFAMEMYVDQTYYKKILCKVSINFPISQELPRFSILLHRNLNKSLMNQI